MDCQCAWSKQAGTCCKGVETATSTAPKSATSSKSGHGTGRHG